jgi:hypothetical protein
MSAPELKQFGELEPEDFQRHPVWIGCHTADYGKPWYEDTDEETFRPYDGTFPADPSEGILLVRAVIELSDGSRYPGFVTPGLGLGTQQPQVFVGDSVFGFWGGIAGIPEPSQRELYAALGKSPDEIFPVRFAADVGLVTGRPAGQIEGFYKKSREGYEVSFTPRLANEQSVGERWFKVSGRGNRGYPQPEAELGYRKVVYANSCPRCGIFDEQAMPFRLKRSVGVAAGFTQLNWVYDAFFVAPDILEQIRKAGITGVSAGPATYHASGETCADRLQLIIPTFIACAETSRLPKVTCRPDNEETVALRARLAQSETPERNFSPELKEYFRKLKERVAALPYCGRVKHHVPTSVSLNSDRLANAPDLFQTAEWFGSGAFAYRLTIASERFVSLVRERRWKGLVFHEVDEDGYSERAI